MRRLMIDVVLHPENQLPHIKPHFMDKDPYVGGEKTIRFFEAQGVELKLGQRYEVEVFAFKILKGKTKDKRRQVKLFVKVIGKVLCKSERFRNE